ncbi:MAG: helicase [Crocinitomicaceae bacterium]|jgi:ATP-dependent RNA helicase RhlE|nr:helicase [Crocinitomicaceae bacterium]
MKFSDYRISPKIKEQLETLGFTRPTDIQFKAITPILNGEDVFAIAYTGTGKTGAFVIPVLDRIDSEKRNKAAKGVKALVLVPTRELALQITDVFQQIGKLLPVKTACIHGGVEQDPQIKQLNDGVDVLVATPGRMFDLVSQGHLDISKVRFLILDEADLMLDLGFKKDILDLMRHIPKKRQTLFFSATITKKIKSFAYDIVRDAIRIQVSPKNPVAKTIDHAVAFIEMDDKRFFLENMLKEFPENRFVVFVRTKVRAERVMAAMKRVELETEFLHGGVDQNERIGILDRFRKGENRVLITTDVASRGIDIPDVDYVINYDLPDLPENYVHRVGRTGRGGKRGQALAFCSPEERELLASIEEYTGAEIEHYEISRGEYNEIISGSEDGSYDWQKLLRDASKEDGTEDEWD